MRGIVAFDSVYGNTLKVAEVAEELRGRVRRSRSSTWAGGSPGGPRRTSRS